MIFRIIRYSLIGILSLFVSKSWSQADYLAEIGVNAGGSYMIDDVNSIPFKNSMLDLGLIYRQNFNERFSAHAEWNSTKINYYNNSAILPVETIRMNMIDLCGEFNFFDLIKKPYKPKSKSFSPYIFAGLGIQFSKNYYNLNFLKELPETMTVPFGVGIKYKLGNRINLNAKWAHRISLNDKIEGTESVLNGTNLFNNDVSSTYTMGVSFDFWKRPCNCNNSQKIRRNK